MHFDFDEIADLALPVTPAAQWDWLVRELAILSPRGDAPRLRLETIDGLRVTTSLERFSAQTLGGDEPAQWLHIVGPAWCSQPLGVPHRRTRTRQVFEPDELPLTCLTPVVNRHRAVLSAAWGIARIDRNVQGGPLRNRGFEYPDGFGVHAEQELAFDLPAPAKTFDCRVGLDAQAGRGGAARAGCWSTARAASRARSWSAASSRCRCPPSSWVRARSG